jgi:membrane protein implicated in regulation of membrane protease activity
MKPRNHPHRVMLREARARSILAAMFLLLALLLLLFLPSPWNLVGALTSTVVFIVEVAFWNHRMRSHKIQTGRENLIGATGEVTEPCEPQGQIRVLGELWQARSTPAAGRGAHVRVLEVRGLTLLVAPTDERPTGDLSPGP